MSKRTIESVDNEIAQHYNSRPPVDFKKRKQSEIFRLKAFNNWIKSVLIQSYSKEGDVVLDLGCGKGGDLLKWKKCKVSQVLCIDIAEKSIEEAQERFNNMHDSPFEAKFSNCDCFKLPLSVVLEDMGFADFDAVSAQFCVHYAFETEAKVRQLLKNVSNALRTGGVFHGTIPNASVLNQKLEETVGLRFGNPVFNVKFESREESDYGRKYWFELKEAIDNCPEFLINFDLFSRLAAEYSLELITSSGFHDYYVEKIISPDNRFLFRKMLRGARDEKDISKEEWETIGLYMVFAFKKV